ncbi:MAG: VWA domain-containing protein [Vicinamibacteria bacterium]
MKKAALALALALAFGALATSVARAQAQRSRQLPVFGAEALVVAVPVFVVDKDGRSVPGLTAEAFEIEDDGKKVPIVAFEAIDAGAPRELGGAGITRAAARRQFLFLFDLSFSTVSGIRRAREAALQVLDGGLAPGDLAAAATFGVAGVKILIGFTSDHQQLRAAFDDLGGAQTERRPDPLGLAFDMGLGSSGSSGTGESERAGGKAQLAEELQAQLIQIDRVEKQVYRNRVTNFLGGLEGLARTLDAVQGRKQVLLLSGGFDPNVLSGVEGIERAEASRAVTEGRIWEVDSSAYFGDTQSSQAMDGVFKALASSDTVIHTVDVAGIAAGGGAETQGPGGGGGRGRESLAQLAINSGGRFVKDTNDVAGAIQGLLDASRYYYVLAFEPRPGGKKPGQLRRLKVRVQGDDIKVSARAGYTLRDPKAPEAAGRNRLEAAEVIAKGISGGAFEVRATATPYRNPQGRLSLPVVLEVDGAGLLAKTTRKGMALEVFGYAFDAEGRIVDVVALTPSLDLGQVRASVEQKGLQILTAFKTAPGPQEIRFLVRDPGTGRAGAVRLEVTVPDFASGRLALSPPLLMDDPRARLVIPAPTRGNPQLEIPFRLGDTPFTLEGAAVLKNGTPREVCVMSWQGANHTTSSKYEVSASLADADARQPVEAKLARIVPDADGFQRFVIAVTAKGAAKGEHALRIVFRDPASGTETATEAPVRVE